ncbi:MAG: SBBP repeat-containing protein [Bacteroidota bacterium]
MFSKLKLSAALGFFFLTQMLYSQGQAIDWVTYQGGSELDDVRAMVIDESGNIYTTGETEGSLPNISIDAHQSTPPGGGQDAYLIKYAPDGQIIWSTYIGGEDDDIGAAIALGPGGDPYVLLTTSSETQLATTGVYQPEYGGGFSDTYLARFSPEGEQIWGTYLGGENNDLAFALTVDREGNAYAVGRTKSFTNLASPGAFQTEIAGDIDAFIYKIDDQGQRVWSTYFGGNRVDLSTGVIVDNAQNVYIGGWTASETNLATGGQQATYGGGQADMFLAKFRADGQRDWCTYYGGINNDFCNGLAFADDGNILVVGSSFSPENISTPGTHQPYSDGSGEAVLAKFSTNAQLIWGTYFGGEQPDVFSEVNSDPTTGKIYVAGYAKSADAISTDCAPQEQHADGIWDATISVFNTDGLLDWSSYLGAAEQEQAYAIAFDLADDAIAVAGITNSITNFAQGNSQQLDYGGGDGDGFVARYELCNPPIARLTDAGYLCDQRPPELLIELIEGRCTYATYAIDDVLQPRVQLQFGLNAIPLPNNEWSTIELIEIGTSDCPGQVEGIPYLIAATESLSVGQVVQQCDSVNQTYTASFRISGRSGTYLENADLGSFESDLFTSLPIPFGQSYSFQISSTAGCESLELVGPFECGDACMPIDLEIEDNYDGCIGENFLIGPFEGEDFRWSGPNSYRSESNQLLVENLEAGHAGIYELIVYHGVICTDTFTFSLAVHENPSISWQIAREPDCRNRTTDIILESDLPNVLFAVDNRSYVDSPSFSALEAGDHNLLAISNLGCETEMPFLLAEPLCPVYAPTAFSPNDDGINDQFKLFADRDLQARITRLDIFDRWGVSIHTNAGLSIHDPAASWNGKTPDGRLAPMGSYIWVAGIETEDGEQIRQSGLVNLIR